MKKLIETLRLKHEAKLSNQRIAAACGLSKGAVHKYLALAKAKNITWPLPADMDEQKLEALIYPAKPRSGEFQLPDFQKMHLECKRQRIRVRRFMGAYSGVTPQRRHFAVALVGVRRCTRTTRLPLFAIL